MVWGFAIAYLCKLHFRKKADVMEIFGEDKYKGRYILEFYPGSKHSAARIGFKLIGRAGAGGGVEMQHAHPQPQYGQVRSSEERSDELKRRVSPRGAASSVISSKSPKKNATARNDSLRSP